jgi:GNAT superfamily N-acetyltransferase
MYTESRVAEWVSKESVLCGVLGNQLVGCVMLRGPQVVGFFVAYEHQRKGIGRLLLNAALEMPQVKKHRRIVVFSSITAEKFYEKNGFKFITHAPSSKYDGVIMYRHIGPDEDDFVVPKFRVASAFAYEKAKRFFRQWFKKLSDDKVRKQDGTKTEQ